MKLIKVILSILIGCTAYLGDYIVFKSKLTNSFVVRALLDNIVHGSLGFLSALAFFSHENHLNLEAYIMNVIFCTAVSSFIDIDHFIVAKSFHIKDLSNLRQRGIFHNTTFWILLSTILLLYSYSYKKLNVYTLDFMILLAFSSHHIRDGNRRGLWLYPFGNSPAIVNYLYILLLTVLPHVIAWFYLRFKIDFSRNVFVDYTTIV